MGNSAKAQWRWENAATLDRTRAGAARRLRLGSAWRRCNQCIQAAVLLAALIFWSPLSAESSADSRVYSLAPGDRVAVIVLGQPELSGEVLVDGAGNILLPFVGSVAVKDLTLLECQKAIVDRLADGVLAHPSVSVRLSEPRPLYILGDVRSPGAYPFRYGATVKRAVALAGGITKLAEPNQSAADSEFLLADERVRQLGLQKLALLVRRARLEAQRDGANTLSPPARRSEETGDVADKDVADIVASEKETLDSQAAILRTQLDLIRSQKPRVESEIAAINGQIDAGKRQLQLVTQETDQYSRMVRQGLGVTSSEMQLKVLQASHESDLWGLTAQVSRLQMESGELDLKLQEIEASFKKQVIADLLDVRYRLKELEVTLVSARKARAVKLEQTTGDNLPGEASYSIRITRSQSGEASIIEANDATALEPGDVVDIQTALLPRRLARPTALAGPHGVSSDQTDTVGTATAAGRVLANGQQADGGDRVSTGR
jgi:polysaccharide export outer membrane protein